MQRQHHISVSPVAGGWALGCGEGLQPMLFLSGACAEQQARNLARRLTAAGDVAEVLVHDRASALIGATRYVAS
jgi:hypothetical protein